jgi:drug/metabolite transporter (DMT)-like permease
MWSSLAVLTSEFLPMAIVSMLLLMIASYGVEAPSHAFNTARFALLGVGFLVALLYYPPLRPVMRMRDWAAAAVCAVLMFAVAMMFMHLVHKHSLRVALPVSNVLAVFLLYMGGIFLFRDELCARHVLGIVLLVIGMWLLVMDKL